MHKLGYNDTTLTDTELTHFSLQLHDRFYMPESFGEIQYKTGLPHQLTIAVASIAIYNKITHFLNTVGGKKCPYKALSQKLH